MARWLRPPIPLAAGAVLAGGLAAAAWPPAVVVVLIAVVLIARLAAERPPSDLLAPAVLQLTEEALRASEARLADAQRLARVGYWEWDPVTGATYWSDELAAVVGPPGDDFQDRLHPDDRPAFEAAVRQVLAERTPHELELRVRPPGGGERWAVCRLTTSADEPAYLQGTLQDVTDRKRAELAAAAAAGRLAEAQRAAKLGGWEFAPGTGEAWWSPEMFRLHGLDPAGPAPTHDAYAEAIHPDDRERAKEWFHGLVADGPGGVAEYRMIGPRGNTWHVRAEVTVDRGPDGRPTRVRGTNQDITDRVRAEDERRRLDARLRESERLESLGVLAGGVAHDFNNLMTGVLGNAALLRELLPPGYAADEFLVPIEKAAAHAGALCQQMLAYAGKGVTVRGPVDLNRVIAESAELVRLSVSKTADVRYAPGAGLPPLEADESQVRQVLLNLVSNASEALGPGGGRIDVRTGRGRGGCCPDPHGPGHRCRTLPDAPAVWVEVRDTGRGMSADTLARVFDPFFSTKFTGRGLGLSAVHGVARSHGGAVCVSSKPGVGTTFRVYLPALSDGPFSPPPARRPTDTPPPPGWSSPGDPAVLVADDDPAVRRVAVASLRGLGLVAVEAADAAAAVEAVRADEANRLRLALVDVTMPGGDGLGVLAEVRRLRPDLPVVLMSGYTEHAVAAADPADRPDGFVQKPFLPADLAALVRRLTLEPEVVG